MHLANKQIPLQFKKRGPLLCRILILAVLSLSAPLYAQKTVSWEIGGYGFIPEVERNPYKIKANTDVQINQSYFYRSDVYPLSFFPFYGSGIYSDWVLGNDKWGIGFGYAFHLEYATAGDTIQTSSGTEIQGFSMKAMDHQIYVKGLWHLKHEQGNTPFVGIKLGLFGKASAVSSPLTESETINANDLQRFSDLPFRTFTPGAMIAFSFGVKIYFLREILKQFSITSPAGMRITIEYSLHTPSFKNSYINASTKEPIDSLPAFILNYSGLTAGISLFFEIQRNKITLIGF